MIFAGIVAGGVGSRMKGAIMPKQFLKANGEPIIVHTINKFLKFKEIDMIYIGILPDWHDHMEVLIKNYKLDRSRIRIADGGSSRNSTVMNIVNKITDDYVVSEGDIIITHDAVRPFVSKKIIKDNIECAKTNKVCGTYLPATDTISKSKDETNILGNLRRKWIYQAQTPQTFEISSLLGCVSTLTDEQLEKLTDTCGIFAANNIPVKMVMGAPENFKITTLYDFKIAKLIMENEDCEIEN